MPSMPRGARSAWQAARRALVGSDPRLTRLLGYWAATAALYGICIVILWLLVNAGVAGAAAARALAIFGAVGVALFYVLVRASTALGIAAWQLAFGQALFAVVCHALAYATIGPARGASLMILLVAVVFCSFSLRRRQTMVLCTLTMMIIGATMATMSWRDPARYPPLVEAIHFGLVAASLLAVALLMGEMSKLRARLRRQKEELLAALATIRKLATIDELTALSNRRHMNEVLHACERRAGASAEAVCIVLIDIDHFKRVNDSHGHAVGDAVLRAFADAARTALRARDVLARWGGEEFLLMLPDTEPAEAMQVLRRVAEQVAAVRVAVPGAELRVTFSGGVAARVGDEPFTDTITRADRAMYEAKSEGRDRIVQCQP
jgi:diguanylate cyclase (GGDEF)-like protein